MGILKKIFRIPQDIELITESLGKADNHNQYIDVVVNEMIKRFDVLEKQVQRNIHIEMEKL